LNEKIVSGCFSSMAVKQVEKYFAEIVCLLQQTAPSCRLRSNWERVM
jgi:hypothetical protein